jgi:hypothetical protein
MIILGEKNWAIKKNSKTYDKTQIYFFLNLINFTLELSKRNYLWNLKVIILSKLIFQWIIITKNLLLCGWVNLSWRRKEASQVGKQKRMPKHQNDVVCCLLCMHDRTLLGPPGWFFVIHMTCKIIELFFTSSSSSILIVLSLLQMGSHFCNWKITKYQIEILNAKLSSTSQKVTTQRKAQSTQPPFAMTNFSKPCAFDSW